MPIEQIELNKFIYNFDNYNENNIYNNKENLTEKI